MHPIAEKFFALDSEGKKNVHISMAKLALESWNKHLAAGNVPLEYQETVTGTHQKVDSSLPADAITAVISNNAAYISERYREPLCAMQDDDWEFNEDAEYAYCAINNTYKKYIEGNEIDDWLIVNQALSSLGEGEDIFSPLEQALSFKVNETLKKSPNKLLQRIKKSFAFLTR